MRETITISLPPAIKQELDQLIKEEGANRSDVVRQALQDYLFTRRFRNLRQRMMAETPDTVTDEDVFKQVS